MFSPCVLIRPFGAYWQVLECRDDTDWRGQCPLFGDARSQSSRYQKLPSRNAFNCDYLENRGRSNDSGDAATMRPEARTRATHGRPATPVVIPPDRPKTPREKVYEVFMAIETLAKSEVDPIRSFDLMLKYQRYRVTDNLDAARAYLTNLEKHWRHQPPMGAMPHRSWRQVMLLLVPTSGDIRCEPP